MGKTLTGTSIGLYCLLFSICLYNLSNAHTSIQAIEANNTSFENINLNKIEIVKFMNKEHLISPIVVSGNFSHLFTAQINRTTEYIFEYIYDTQSIKNKAIRVTVQCPTSKYIYPLLVVVRQQKSVLSWQLPLEPPPNTLTMEEYKLASRTLCSMGNEIKSSNNHHVDSIQRLFIDVSTSSHIPLNFSLNVEILQSFALDLLVPKEIQSSPGESVYYYFKFPEDVEMVLVKAMSEDDLCAIVAVQNISCPVFDTEEDVKYANLYQTMTLRAGITVRKEKYPNGFYVSVVTLSSDDSCSPNYQHIFLHRVKKVTLLVDEKITFLEYMAAIFAGLGFCAFFYVVVLILACVEYIRWKKRSGLPGLSLESDLMDDSMATGTSSYENTIHSYESASTVSIKEEATQACAISNCSSLEEQDYDILEDVESEKDVFRTKTLLFVSDLARKRPEVLRHKSFLYNMNLLTVAIFYAVPVVQLVVTYQKVLDETGNQDICFYNFWCAHPLGPLSDFNHVYSNIAYILFGVLFVGLSARRDLRHRKASRRDPSIDRNYGIPQHFGIFYAMGVALIMEGLLSACYHICPNYSNFQFDTAFMYVIAVLCMLKIYQTRHPDINASANATYLLLAWAVLFGVVGVLDGTVYFWALFAFIHVTLCSVLTGRLYYMGRWSFDRKLPRRFLAWFHHQRAAWRSFLRPAYPDRVVLLLLGNAANWGLALYGVIRTPADFASYMLIIFLTNLILYTGFYILMKLRHREKIRLQPLIYIALCAFAWGAAAYFYLHPSTTWEMSPAHSRVFNKECTLLHFYDSHDIWHFLSAAAMFFGFMLLLTLDDDIAFKLRTQIPVF